MQRHFVGGILVFAALGADALGWVPARALAEDPKPPKGKAADTPPPKPAPPKPAPGKSGPAKPEPPKAGPPETKPAALVWLTGWEAGRAEAAKTGKLAFVYVRGVDPLADGCREVEEGPLAAPETVRIAEHAVPVRVDVSAESPQSVRDFLTRYGIQSYPAFAVIDADGHMLGKSMTRSSEAILAAVDRAVIAQQDFAESRKRTDEESKAWVRECLGIRLAWEELIPLQEADVTAAPMPERYAELARLYQRACKRADEAQLLAKMIDLYPKDLDRTRWRMRLATIPVDLIGSAEDQSRQTFELLQPLASELYQEKNTLGESQVRVVMAHAMAKLRMFDEACQIYDYVIQLDPSAKTAAIALLGKASIAWAKYDYATCRAVCQRVCREFPASDEARQAKATIASCDARTK